MAATETATLMAGGRFSGTALLRMSAGEGGALVGIDSGAATLLGLGLMPDIVIGDFDSLSEALRAQLAAAGAQIVPAPDQYHTDLDKALGYCIETLGVKSARVFGATGGRLDHTCAALSAMVKYGRRADVRLVDAIGETRLVTGQLRLSGAALPGRTLSLIAFSRAEGVRLDGVRWPLHGETLAPGLRDGTSNVIVSDVVTISAESGDLLLFLHHPGIDIKGE